MSIYVETTLGDFVIDLQPSSAVSSVAEIAEAFSKTKLTHLDKGLIAIFTSEHQLALKNASFENLRFLSFGLNDDGHSFFISLSKEERRGVKKIVLGFLAEASPKFLDSLNDLFTDRQKTPLEPFNILGVHVLYDPSKPDSLGASFAAGLRAAASGAESQRVRDDRALIALMTASLQLLGDIPTDLATGKAAEPSPSCLFVAKLNPITKAEDLTILFNRFGEVKNIEIVKDRDGHSLGYGFVEYDCEEAVDRALSGLKNCIIDDRKIVVDYSQSTSKRRKI